VHKNSRKHKNFYIPCTNTPENTRIFILGAQTLPKTKEFLYSAHKHSRKRKGFYFRCSNTPENARSFIFDAQTLPKIIKTEILSPPPRNQSIGCRSACLPPFIPPTLPPSLSLPRLCSSKMLTFYCVWLQKFKRNADIYRNLLWQICLSLILNLSTRCTQLLPAASCISSVC
jgi:hypothetical protein